MTARGRLQASAFVLAAAVVSIGPMPGRAATAPGENGRIAYACAESTICLLTPLGTPARSLQVPGAVHELAWAPDGEVLAFRTFEGNRSSIYTIRPDGSGLRRLTRDPRSAGPVWAPDGSRIYYEVELSATRSVARVMNADGTGDAPLQGRAAVLGFGRWSPFGRLIAFYAGGAVHVAWADGTHERGVGAADSLDWAPSGRGLLRTTHAGLRTLRLDGRSGAFAVRHKAIATFEVAPEGNLIVFSTIVADEKGLEKLFITPAGAAPSAAREIRLGGSPPEFEQLAWQPRCTVYGTRRRDVLSGTPSRDVICGLDGDDLIRGGGGDDVILGGGGDDCLEGAAGEDWLLGGDGADTISARAGDADAVDGGPGFDSASVDAPIVDVSRGVERTSAVQTSCSG